MLSDGQLTAAELRQMATKDLAANSPVVFCLPDGRRLKMVSREIIPLVAEENGRRKFAGPPTLTICLEIEPPPEKMAKTRSQGSGV